MRILCISHEYPPIGGGGATALKNIARQYVKLGHSTTVITSSFENLPIFEADHEVKIHRLKCKRKKKDHSSFIEMLSFLLAAYRFIQRIIKKEHFDVVHIFFGIPSGPLGWYVKKRYNIPYVIRLGGGDIPGTQKRFNILYKILSPIIKVIWKNALYVVANSSGLLKRAKSFYSGANFIVIPNGINIEDYPENKEPRKDMPFRIVTTARLVERKGIQHIIKALPDIIKNTSGNLRYTIIGDGPYRIEIERLLAQYDISDYVKITGFIPFEQVIGHLSNADAFALLSHWEGMPNVVLEAMAMRLPIIMTDCEGSDELMTNNGYVIPLDRDISSMLAKKIALLYNNRELLTNMGRNSYSNVRANFTWKQTAKTYTEIFGSQND